MRTWDASSAGSSFPREDFPFTVHSVFARAVNLRPRGGALLSLVSDSELDHPRAAVVLGAPFDHWGLTSGTPGTFVSGLLTFDWSDWAVRFPLVRRAGSEEAISGFAAAVPPTRRRQSLERAASAVAASVKARGAETVEPFASRLEQGARALQAAVAKRSAPVALEACQALVGLGPGLTPAADDFLCGWLAGLRSQAPASAGLRKFLEDLTVAFRGPPDLLAATSDISAAFLGEALHGRFASSLVAFAEAAVGLTLGLEESVRVLAGLGHSSGTDAATGFLFAFGQKEAGDEA